MKRMKFFNNHITTLKSNCQLENSVFPCDAQGTPEPSHCSNYLYSTLHSQHPKNADPNNVSSTSEILVASDGNCDLSIALLNCSHSKTEDTLHEDERDLYSLRLSESLHSQNRKLELSNLYSGTEYHLSAHDNDISLSIPSERLSGLHYESYDDTLSQCKDTKFIETKSSRNKLRGFNH